MKGFSGLTGATIIGIGHTLGSRKITNIELVERLSPNLVISASEIEQKTGIKQRYWCDTKKENLYVLLASAMEQALWSSGIEKEAITDLFVTCNPTSDYLLPNTASLVADISGLKKIKISPIGTGCAGPMIALESILEKLFYHTLASEERTVALIVGDQTSNILGQNMDRALFSDAASCFIIKNNRKGLYDLNYADHITFTESCDALRVLRDGTLIHDGRAVYRFATSIVPYVKELTGLEDFSSHHIIPHQANIRIIDKIAQSLNAVDCYSDGVINLGNTGPASTFIGLEDMHRRDMINKKKLLLVAFGEGLTVGVAELYKTGRNLTVSGRLSDEELHAKYMEIYNKKWS